MSQVEAPTQAFIAGSWLETGRTFEVRTPIDRQVIAQVADCGPEEARRAADAAVEAFAAWKQATAYERAAVLRRWYELMMQHAEGLARTMTLEMGKPLREARAEVRYAAGFVEWYAEEAKRVYGEVVPSQFPHKRLLALKQPVGPVFAITPWNFPAAMITRKAAPALAAGCTVILKPAEQSPLTALYLAKLWEEAGGPPGTLQVLPAQDPVPLSEVLISDERIRKLTFTGSTEVGKLLYEKAARTMKRVSLELGGHAPFLIFEDADIEKAVEQAMIAKFRNIGQSCVAANRLYVHARIKDAFAEAYAARVRRMKVGNPLEEDTEVGPLVDERALEKVQAHVEDARKRGARVVAGGQVEGLTFHPTVLVDVAPEARILQEETFGPVAPILAFEDESEAIQYANRAPYGLAAYVWTRDLSRAWRVAEALEYGIVGVNDGVPSTPQAPFGGMKYSGVGREGGKWGLEEFLEVKYVSMALP
ncbi:NAD-dependent succinate-semialdehyde dehydrogenase [Marinithermus hydrothermalis]|uniref:Succinate-semialdehyde dehydrogenase n=1 Tax=Marinithermus hydrothermalis (strain DSM 14884 / JCM 11576 / T1) TaxID=869210 RepID=F2NQF2_MARHT|nr:NAD-dependent succinate-semialdehyde dehydrogenase [Marinithermus hydrothermalis]AEB11679.1 Succinate-semialdehyde dehydrogenase [Marinithermus hydrothermalis DSM 14884]